MSKHVHLVLGPGGVQALSLIGAIGQLQKEGYTFASISGCSAGSFVGALIAAGQTPEDLEAYFMKLDIREFGGRERAFAFLHAFWKWPFAQKVAPGLPYILRNILQADPKISDLNIPFATVGLDIVTNRFVIFGGDSCKLKLSEIISISTAAPFLFPPAEMDGRIVVDAAVATACPVWLAGLHDGDLPIVSLNCVGVRDAKRPSSFPGFLTRIIEASAVAKDEEMMPLLARVTRIDINCNDVGTMDFTISEQQKRMLFESGKRAICDAREKLQERTGRYSSNPLPHSRPLKPAGSAALEASSVIYNFYQKEVTMNNTNNTQVGGDAIINIGSQLNQVTQKIDKSTSLAPKEKDDLKKLADEMVGLLKEFATKNPDEAALITSRLNEVVEGASKGKEERKKSLLTISADGLVAAAKAVGDASGNILLVAGKIAAFIAGL